MAPRADDEQLKQLLDFCVTHQIIFRYSIRNDKVWIEAETASLPLDTAETWLFLEGALRYRPDVRVRFRNLIQPWQRPAET